MCRSIIALTLLSFACGGSSTSAPDAGNADPPIRLQATPGNAVVALSWNAIDGATSYEISRIAQPTDPPLVTTSTTTSFTDVTVRNAVFYTYTVVAVTAGGKTASSNAVTAEPFRLLCAADTRNSALLVYNAEQANAAAPLRSFGSATGVAGITFSGIDVDPVHGELFAT